MKRCPTPHKTTFAKRRRALMAANRVYRAGGSPVRMRAYKCMCGEWHLTKRGAIDEAIRQLLTVSEAA